MDVKNPFDHRMTSNVVHALIRNQSQARVKKNYSSYLKDRYPWKQTYISSLMNRYEGDFLKSRKYGRKNVFKVDWPAFADWLSSHPEEARIYGLEWEEVPDGEKEVQKDLVGRVHDLVEEDEFVDFLKIVFQRYSHKEPEIGGEEDRFEKPVFHVQLRAFLLYTWHLSEGVDRLVERIAEESGISVEKAWEVLRVEEGKKPLLKQITGLQEIGEDGEEVDLSHHFPPKTPFTEAFYSSVEDYFELTLDGGMALEKQVFDRMP